MSDDFIKEFEDILTRAGKLDIHRIPLSDSLKIIEAYVTIAETLRPIVDKYCPKTDENGTPLPFRLRLDD